MKKFITIVLTIGIILRLILSSVTYHSDVVPFDFAGRVIASGNVINFYDYLWDLPEDHPECPTCKGHNTTWVNDEQDLDEEEDFEAIEE